MIGYTPPALATGMATLWPLSFCQTRGLDMLFVNGLQRPFIWDGLQAAPDDAGISPPSSGPTVATPSGGAATAGTYYCGYRYYDPVHGTYSALSPLTTVIAAENDKFSWSDIADDPERGCKKQLFRSTMGQSDKFYLIATLNDGTTTYSTDTTSDDTLGTTWTVDQILDLLTADQLLWARRQVVPPNYMRVCVPFQDRSAWGVLAIYAVGTASINNGSPTLTGVGTAWTSAMAGRKVYLVGGDRAYTIQAVGGATSITLSENYAGTTLSGVRYAIMADPQLWGNTIGFSEQDEFESVPMTQNTIGVQESLASDNDWLVGMVPHGTTLWALKTRHVYSVTFSRQPKVDIGCALRFDRGAFNFRCADYLEGTLYLMDAMGPWAIGPGDQYVPLGPPIQDYFRDDRVDFGKREWWFVSCDTEEKVVRFFVTLVGQTGNLPKTALCLAADSQKWWVETYPEGLGGACRVEHLGKVRTVVGGSYGNVLLLNEGQSDGCSCQGSVSAATSTSLSDSVQSPFTADMVGYDVTIIHGTGAGQVREILSLASASQITVAAWETTPDTTSRYAIVYAIRGTATGATASTLSDSGKTFPAQLAGATIAILSGTGAGQLRLIKTVSGSQLTVSVNWTTTPSTDSVYLVGAVECTYRTGILELPSADPNKPEDVERAVELAYEPTVTQQDIGWRLLWDHLTTGEESWLDFTKAGLSTVRGNADKTVNLRAARSGLATAPGIERIPFRVRASKQALSHRFLASELHWFQGEEEVKLYKLGVE